MNRDLGARWAAAATAGVGLVVVLVAASIIGYGTRLDDATEQVFTAASAPPSEPSADGSDPAPTTSPEHGTPTGGPVDPPATVDAQGALEALLADARVVPKQPDISGYDRDCGSGDGCVFGTEWTDDSSAPDAHNGCDTRNDVLGETLDDVTFDPGSHRCDVVGGDFTDPYSGQEMDYATEGSDIHIDHLFPLAAAWDLGAADWSIDERTAFANDTDLELLAVNGGENIAKSDSTPASWLPPDRTFRCTYVTDYLEVANAYDLALTSADVRAIESVAGKHC